MSSAIGKKARGVREMLRLMSSVNCGELRPRRRGFVGSLGGSWRGLFRVLVVYFICVLS